MTLPQLYRSSRTSLVRLQIRDYQLVVLFMIEICTLFVCYACIGYFSRFACAFTHVACFMNLSIYGWFYRFFGFSLLSLSQLYRSDRTSLLMVTNQIQSVCRSIGIRQSICLHAISFPNLDSSVQRFILVISTQLMISLTSVGIVFIGIKSISTHELYCP